MKRQVISFFMLLTCLFVSANLCYAANLTQLTNGGGIEWLPTYSPDGSKIAYNDQNNIWVMNSDGANKVQLTSSGKDTVPSWSPDGKKILFNSSRDGNYDLYTINVDGTNLTRITFGLWCGHPRWSPDGSEVAYNSGNDIWVINIDGTNARRLTHDFGNCLFAEWNKNKKIAFSSNVSGSYNIYTMNADGSNKVMLTNELSDVRGKIWSPDGTKIVYYTEDGSDHNFYIIDAHDKIKTVANTGISGKKYVDIHPNGYDLLFSSNESGIYHIYKYTSDIYIGTRDAMPKVPVGGLEMTIVTTMAIAAYGFWKYRS